MKKSLIEIYESIEKSKNIPKTDLEDLYELIEIKLNTTSETMNSEKEAYSYLYHILNDHSWSKTVVIMCLWHIICCFEYPFYETKNKDSYFSNNMDMLYYHNCKEVYIKQKSKGVAKSHLIQVEVKKGGESIAISNACFNNEIKQEIIKALADAFRGLPDDVLLELIFDKNYNIIGF